jgi:hypothetical protein
MVKFELEKRKNAHNKSGFEYAISVNLGLKDMNKMNWWAIIAYEKKPSSDEVDKIINIFLRSWDIYSNGFKPLINATFENFRANLREEEYSDLTGE